MRAAGLALALLVGGCSKDAPPEGRREEPQPKKITEVGTDSSESPDHRTFPTARAAFAAIVDESKPTVLGLGEKHDLVGAAPVKPALERFADELLPVLGEARASDLVLETWVEDPSCSRKAEAVRTEVAANLARPPETESVLLATMRRAKALGIRNHGLVMKCDHYESLRTESGEVDYAKLLSLVTKGLLGRAKELTAREDARLVVLYGGALHNDVYPNAGVEEWSYAADVSGLTPRYVEVDLYVPELADHDAMLAKEPWFEFVGAADDEVQVIRRGPRSYVMILRRGVKPAPRKPAESAPAKPVAD